VESKKVKEELLFSWPAIILVVLLFLNFALLYLNQGNNLSNTIRFLLNFTPTNIKNYILSFGVFAPIVIILLIIAQSLIAPIPGHFILIASGMIYGPLVGGLIVMTGTLIGAILCFKISEHFGRPILERIMDRKSLDAIDNFMREKKGFITFLLIRLNPVISFDMISYGAGLTKMNFVKYLIATVISVVIGSFIYTTIGYEILKVQLIPIFILSILLIALMIGIPVLKEKMKW
jgi:uncharacterized membrane protein YdjX (TVP38/TMEM64 family)